MNEYQDLIDALNFKKEKIPRDRRIFINIALIESFLKTGITIKSLVEDLNENGFIIGYDDFKNGLNRARRKLKTQGNKQTGVIKSANTQQQIFSYEKNINEEKDTNVQEVKTTIHPVIDKTAVINQVSTPKETKSLTTKEIMAETERYNEQHEVEKAKKEQAQRDKKLLALIDKQNKGK